MYLDEETYREWGGLLETTAFNRFSSRATGIIDTYTSNRLKSLLEVPEVVSRCMFEIIEYLGANTSGGAQLASHSEGAGPVTQTDTYVIKDAVTMDREIETVICDYLLPTGLLYRGAKNE